MAAHAFTEKFFPTITILRQRGVGVRFAESGDGRVLLLVAVINASGGGVKETAHASGPGGHEQVGVDEHAQHAERLVLLDKTHAAHVGGEIVDDGCAVHRAFARGLVLQVEHEVLHAVEALIPALERLYVHTADGADALPPQVRHQVAANEAAATTHHGHVVAHVISI